MGAGASAADEGATPPGPAGDPWASKSGAEALQLIREEEGEPVTVEEAEGLAAALGAATPNGGALFCTAESVELTTANLASFVASLEEEGAEEDEGKGGLMRATSTNITAALCLHVTSEVATVRTSTSKAASYLLLLLMRCQLTKKRAGLSLL